MRFCADHLVLSRGLACVRLRQPRLRLGKVRPRDLAVVEAELSLAGDLVHLARLCVA